MKVWITKYALTKDIFIKETEDEVETQNVICIKGESCFNSYFHKDEWHKTEEAAIKRAEDMRKRKIKSLEKQLNKIKNIKF